MSEKAESISDAQDFYNQLRKMDMFDDYKKLIDDLIVSNYNREINNYDYTHALLLTGGMLRHTKQSMLMLTGPDGDDFLKQLADELEPALRRIKRNNGCAQILILDDKNLDFIDQISEKIPDVLTYNKASVTSGAQMGHFIVCDSRMVRIEESHERLTSDTRADIVHAKVYFNSPVKANVYEDRFEGIWDYLKR